MGHQWLDLFPSPLRYPGGKRKVANFVKLIVLENELTGGEYVEPYAGGAGVALALLFEGYVEHIHINDIDRSVYSFWNSVLTDPDALCRRIWDTAVDMDQWHRQHEIQSAPDPFEIDLAFSTFFLNRCNRSGIIAGGVIGGKDQFGKWKLDARYNKAELTRRIEKVARFASRISLTQLDASEFLETWTDETGIDTLIYLDPPYYVKGEGLYQNFYEHHNHEDIAEIVTRLAVPWMVSYDAAPEILDMYAGHSTLRYSLSYSAADRYSGPEVMYFARCLVVPDVPSPAGIRPNSVDEVRHELFNRLARS
jgi:DNA adenine methylase